MPGDPFGPLGRDPPRLDHRLRVRRRAWGDLPARGPDTTISSPPHSPVRLAQNARADPGSGCRTFYSAVFLLGVFGEHKHEPSVSVAVDDGQTQPGMGTIHADDEPSTVVSDHIYGVIQGRSRRVQWPASRHPAPVLLPDTSPALPHHKPGTCHHARSQHHHRRNGPSQGAGRRSFSTVACRSLGRTQSSEHLSNHAASGRRRPVAIPHGGHCLDRRANRTPTPAMLHAGQEGSTYGASLRRGCGPSRLWSSRHGKPRRGHNLIHTERTDRVHASV